MSEFFIARAEYRSIHPSLNSRDIEEKYPLKSETNDNPWVIAKKRKTARSDRSLTFTPSIHTH